MAKDKKGFVLYTDLIHTVNKMTSEQAGELFKHILKYVNDENPEPVDILIDLTFEPIKQQLKRDLKHWESVVESRARAGSLGGKQKIANASKAKQSVANLAVIVNDNVNVNVTDNVIVNDTVKVKEIKEKLIFPFDNSDFLETWNILTKEPKWKRKSNTALQASLNKLSKVSVAEAIEMLNNAIAGGWQGVFELTNNNKNNGTKRNYNSDQANVDALNGAADEILRNFKPKLIGGDI